MREKTYIRNIMHDPILGDYIWPYNPDPIRVVDATLSGNQYLASRGRGIRLPLDKVWGVPQETRYYLLVERSLCETAADGGEGGIGQGEDRYACGV